jgi:hypothetical protein
MCRHSAYLLHSTNAILYISFSLKWTEDAAVHHWLDGQSLADAFDEVEALYRSRGLQCYRWVPAAGEPTEPIETFLTGRNFHPARELAMILTSEVQIPIRDDIRIAPARAMRKALREIKLSDTRYEVSKRPMLADAKNERLDDPQYDMFVATVNGTPAATGTLFQVGDIGSIQDVFVIERFRRLGNVERGMVG